MNIIIRQAMIEDYSKLCEAFKEGDFHHSEILPYFFKKYEGVSRTKEYIESIISNEDEILLAAELNEKIVGVIYGYIKERPDINILVKRKFASVENLVVLKEFRKLGIGKKLMDEFENIALSHEAEDIRLNVYEANKDAVQLYENLGYTTFSRKMIKKLD